MLCCSGSTSTSVEVTPHETAKQCCFKCLFVWIAVAVVAIIIIRR